LTLLLSSAAFRRSVGFRSRLKSFLAGAAIFETRFPMTVEDSSLNTAIGQNLYPNRIANGADTTGVRRPMSLSQG
jgi:hypothetical protein